jgi:hypothetical protein
MRGMHSVAALWLLQPSRMAAGLQVSPTRYAAMGHLLQMPGLGIPALRAWRQRSRVRGDSAR